VEYYGTKFKIIGKYISWGNPDNKPFTGVFDGNDHKITHFTFHDRTKNRVGIFGYTGAAFQARDVHLEDVNIAGDCYVGGLVGDNYGTVEHCSVTGVITGTEDVGGLIGMNELGSQMADCNSSVIMLNDGYLFAVGCLIGYNFEGDVINCFSAGVIDGNDDTYMAGGLVGFNRGRISKCYSTADVSGYWYIGGLIGEHDWYSLVDCYATGNVTCEEAGGGLVGRNYMTILHCYATGNVSCIYGAGGLIGEDWGGGGIECYSKGAVTGTTNIGGMVGVKDSSVSFTNCFWDVNTSGQSNSAGGTGLTTEQMMQQASFTGWDFSDTDGDPADWMMLRPDEDYPRLIWQEIFDGDIAGLYGVDNTDLEELASHWLQTGCPTGCEDADIDGSGLVDLLDFAMLAADWLEGVTP
jgi:hypothetical protein